MMKLLTRTACLAALAVLCLAAAAPASALETRQPQTCAATAVPLAAQPDATYAFEGCWAWFPAGPCYDVYRDSSGGYWICRLCGTTTNPGPGQCSRITIQTLNTGWWCS
jgi:hypothetical protein